MKKLIAMMFLLILGANVMAQWGWDWNWDTPTQKNYDLRNGTHDYAFVTGNKNLTYTATGSNITGRNTSSETKGNAHVYFTTLSAEDLAKTGNTTVAVQFLGVDLDDDQKKNLDNPKYYTNDPNYSGHDVYHVVDYGIYLYDPENPNAERTYMSVKEYKNYFEIGADATFGVYYEDADGHICTTTENYAGNYDTNSHKITVYEDGQKVTKTTDTRFMCLMGKQWAGYDTDHWEFMLQTTLDNPYYPVNPNDFTGGDVPVTDPVVNGDQVPSGQPLPGTMATLLIGSLCASALRKKNQK